MGEPPNMNKKRRHFIRQFENTFIIYRANLQNLKKRLKEISKELKGLHYVESNGVDEKVAINIDLARKYLVDSVFKQAMLEGVATTYSDIETIINGGKVKDMTASDINKVINLKEPGNLLCLLI